MRTDHLLNLLQIIQDDMKRRCEQSFYEEHRDEWSKHHDKIRNVINSMQNVLICKKGILKESGYQKIYG